MALGVSSFQLVASIAIVAGCFYAGKGYQTHDVEIWNGQITSKARLHGEYEKSYSCMCVKTCTGPGPNPICTEICQTCYETHYTVKWKVESTLGGYTIATKDRTSKSVYLSPDPDKYRRTYVGEPCSSVNSYINYIKAVPESLFRPSSKETKEKFAKLIPKYPIDIYDTWNIDRVLPVNVKMPDVADWNKKLSDKLKTIGPAKQANAVIVLVNTNDRNYSYALRDAWLNGKKNDVVLIIGTTKFPEKADWVDVLAFVDNELFKIKLRDDIMGLDTLTADKVIDTLASNITTNFKRKSMKNFKYLESEIDPPSWLILVSVILTFLIYIVPAYLMIHSNRKQTPRRRN